MGACRKGSGEKRQCSLLLSALHVTEPRESRELRVLPGASTEPKGFARRQRHSPVGSKASRHAHQEARWTSTTPATRDRSKMPRKGLCKRTRQARSQRQGLGLEPSEHLPRDKSHASNSLHGVHETCVYLASQLGKHQGELGPCRLRPVSR